MSLIQAVILALIQGLTEFLPISSSAHLALTPWLLGWKDQGLAFDIALHAGTLAAVVFYFFRDWLQIIAQGFGLEFGHDPILRRNRHLFWLLVVASLPVGLAGLLLKKYAETHFRSPFIMGTMLIVVGIVMELADRYSKRNKGIEHVTMTDSAVIGCAQALAIVPGTSRSGITMSAALFQHLDRPTAARFSFLMSTPAIFAAAAKQFLDVRKAGGIPDDMWVPIIVGILVSAISGCAAIGFLMQYLRKASLRAFVLYRVIFGIIIIALAFFRHPAE